MNKNKIENEKIIQIIPAPENLFAVYEDEEGEFETKVVCLGLTNIGNVILMDIDYVGDVGEVGSNIKRIKFK